MTFINLLDQWYKNAVFISSPLNITPYVSRNKVVFIYNTLLSFFGLKFFDVEVNLDKPIEKISWLFQLLSNNNHLGCTGALYEIAELIEYSMTLDESIKKELCQLKRNPQNLRTFFFELFIYKLLDKNQIPNKKKTLINNQIIEGTCIILEKEYLFECRKIFMPNIEELDIMRRLMIDFQQYRNTMEKGVGMICTITFKLPLIGEHQSSFKKKIKEYFEGFDKFTHITKIDYFIEDTFGEFKAIDYNEATLIEIGSSKKYDILFYIIPPKVLIPSQPNRYNVGITCSFSIYENKIYQKSETALKEKKKQHKDSPFTNKIIFIDSETLPEFRMGLFQHESTFNINKIKDVYNKLHLKDIVCITRRFYLDEQPKILVDIISNDRNKVIVDALQSLFKQ